VSTLIHRSVWTRRLSRGTGQHQGARGETVGVAPATGSSRAKASSTRFKGKVKDVAGNIREGIKREAGRSRALTRGREIKRSADRRETPARALPRLIQPAVWHARIPRGRWQIQGRPRRGPRWAAPPDRRKTVGAEHPHGGASGRGRPCARRSTNAGVWEERAMCRGRPAPRAELSASTTVKKSQSSIQPAVGREPSFASARMAGCQVIEVSRSRLARTSVQSAVRWYEEVVDRRRMTPERARRDVESFLLGALRARSAESSA